jgi:hypothetical protein
MTDVKELFHVEQRDSGVLIAGAILKVTGSGHLITELYAMRALGEFLRVYVH